MITYRLMKDLSENLHRVYQRITNGNSVTKYRQKAKKVDLKVTGFTNRLSVRTPSMMFPTERKTCWQSFSYDPKTDKIFIIRILLVNRIVNKFLMFTDGIFCLYITVFLVKL